MSLLPGYVRSWTTAFFVVGFCKGDISPKKSSFSPFLYWLSGVCSPLHRTLRFSSDRIRKFASRIVTRFDVSNNLDSTSCSLSCSALMLTIGSSAVTVLRGLFLMLTPSSFVVGTRESTKGTTQNFARYDRENQAS